MIGRVTGAVLAVHGSLVEASIVGVGLGDGVRLWTRSGASVPGKIVGIDGSRATVSPFGRIDGLAAGDRIDVDATALGLVLGLPNAGRAIDPTGAPLDCRPRPRGAHTFVGTTGRATPQRAAIAEMFWTGVRAIDGPLALGRGARIGLFGAPGCGKSTLLEQIVNGSNADATVVGLVGERGREAERWLARIDSRTTIVCATSERHPAERVRAAEVAFAQAEHLGQRGLHVLLVLDSLARVAAAARDIAVAGGEPVGRGGYPASVFGLLAGLLERAGAFATGSITLVATVLSDGADERDPVSDACRAALDGHIALSERLARAGWFPAIDVPGSASRTMGDVASPRHRMGARALRSAIASLEETREARTYGLDPAAHDPAVRRALAAQDAIAAFVRQGARSSSAAQTLTELDALTDRLTDGYLC